MDYRVQLAKIRQVKKVYYTYRDKKKGGFIIKLYIM